MIHDLYNPNIRRVKRLPPKVQRVEKALCAAAKDLNAIKAGELQPAWEGHQAYLSGMVTAYETAFDILTRS